MISYTLFRLWQNNFIEKINYNILQLIIIFDKLLSAILAYTTLIVVIFKVKSSNIKIMRFRDILIELDNIVLLNHD